MSYSNDDGDLESRNGKMEWNNPSLRTMDAKSPGPEAPGV